MIWRNAPWGDTNLLVSEFLRPGGTSLQRCMSLDGALEIARVRMAAGMEKIAQDDCQNNNKSDQGTHHHRCILPSVEPEKL